MSDQETVDDHELKLRTMDGIFRQKLIADTVGKVLERYQSFLQLMNEGVEQEVLEAHEYYEFLAQDTSKFEDIMAEMEVLDTQQATAKYERGSDA